MDYSYSTNRLVVREWHSVSSDEWDQENLAIVVKNILTPQVTQSLPPAWQGSYTLERANNWIKERDEEGVTLVVFEKSTRSPIGFIILFESARGKDLRLGYLLTEPTWGKGFATELIEGFVEWCENNDVSTVTGGVESDNIASIRVLEKNKFVCESHTDNNADQMYVLRIRHDS